MSRLRGRWNIENAPRLDWRLSACFLVLFLGLVGLGFGDWRPVRALLLLSGMERAISVIGTRLRRESWLTRPFWGWGHVAETTLALAVLGFALSELQIGRLWALQSFWIEFWQVAAAATVEGYLVILIWQVFRGVRATIFATTVFTIGVSILIAVLLSRLLVEAIRLFGG